MNTFDWSHPLTSELDCLDTEVASPQFSNIDELSVAELAQMMNQQDASVAAAVRAALPQIVAAAENISARMSQGGRLVYVGAGTAGRLGVLDASEIPPTFRVPPELVVGLIAGGDGAIRGAVEGAEDNEAAGRAAIGELAVSRLDTVVGLTASGRTPYVVAAIEEARRRGAYTVGLVCNRPTVLAQVAQQPVEVLVGPEFISGSTRLKSGTAQKMVLNMFSTIAMVQLGKTFGNLMVDLQASNDKLRQRAVRIVQAVAQTDAAASQQALELAAWDVKLAVLMLELGIGVGQAQERLLAAEGRLKKALHQP